jgi:hypothetical protein
MGRLSLCERIDGPMKKTIITLIALLVLLGCMASRNEMSSADLEQFKIGDTAYVCGCPMMCCNSISRKPGGRCNCNNPMKKGIVSRIQDGRVYVRIADGREKSFFINHR